MYRKYMSIIALLLLLTLGGTGTAETDGIDRPMEYDEFLAAVPDWMEGNGVPGLGMAVIQDGQLLGVYGFGEANKTSGEPATAETVFQLGALSKPASGWVILRYFAAHDLDIDAPLTDFVSSDQLPIADQRWQRVSMAQLLSHRSGLSGAGYGGYDPADTVPSLTQSLASQPLEFRSEPGAEYFFSSPGYSVAQHVVEIMSERNFAELADEYLWQALAEQGVSYAQDPKGHLARGHGFYGAEMPLYRYPETAAAGLSASAAGLVPWIMAHLEDDGLLPATLMEQIMFPVDEAGYQTLLFSRQVLPEGTEFLASSGANRGFRSYLALVPESNSALLLLTNSDRGHFLVQEVFPAWMGVVSGELITASPMAAFWVWALTAVIVLAGTISVFFSLRRLPLRLPARPMPFFVLVTTAPVGLSFAWIWFWHTDWLMRTAQGQAHLIPAQFMPKNFWVLSMAIVVSVLLLVGFAILRQMRGKRDSAN